MGALRACLVVLFLAPAMAWGAKVRVMWTNPTQNTDGTAITNLASVTVAWGSCAGVGIFGTPQASITVPTASPGAVLSAYAFPVGLSPVCLRACATNSLGHSSAWSAVVTWTPPTLGQPVALGQPIILH